MTSHERAGMASAWRSHRFLAAVVAILVALGSLGAPRVARAQRTEGPTPPRLAFFDGEVSFWRPGAEDWAPAHVNTALAAGDALYAGDGANFEVQVGTRSFVRAGSGTELGIESLETGYLQLRVTSGHAALDLDRLPEGQRIEVDAPNGAFLIDRPGYYRLDVDDRTTFIARRGGPVTVIPAGGETTDIREGGQIVLEGTETATVVAGPAIDVDAWDRWNYDRTARLGERPRSAKYVPPDVAGVYELDYHGEWRDTPRYGHVWAPRGVAADWAPYTTGDWVWDPYYGWTWVDDAPWGWAPYHYGRWCLGRWVLGLGSWADNRKACVLTSARRLFRARRRVGQRRTSVRQLGRSRLGRACRSVVGARRIRRPAVLGWMGRTACRKQRRHQQHDDRQPKQHRQISEFRRSQRRRGRRA